MNSSEDKIPVILLAGWLGSGKTTVLNHILSSDDVAGNDVALVVNEFGEVGVDGLLVESGGRSLWEINKGSLFCICTKVDFVRAMLEIRDAENKKASAVLIEATGVAEAVDLESLLAEPIVNGAFDVRAVICVVDAASFVKTAAFSKAAASQVRSADLLVVNKCDLVDSAALEQLQKLLGRMNDHAKIVCCENGRFDCGVLDGLAHTPRVDGYISDGPPRDIVSVSVRDDRSVDRSRWERVIESLGEKLLRLKGNVCFAALASVDGSCDECKLVEITASTHSEGEPVVAMTSRYGKTAFAAIASGLSEQELKDCFEQIFV